MYTPTFEELAGDEATFFAEYFNKKPLLRRGALAGRCRDLLTMSDLDEFLYSEAIRPPYVRLSKKGDSVVPESYTGLMRVQGEYVADSVDPERVIAHFRTGATITWNSVNQFRPNLRALTAALAERFAVRSDVIAFLTPAGRQGFLPHYDPVDLFIVQLEGTKYWRVWPSPEVRRGDNAHFTLEQLGEPLFAASLEPGDVLYLPYNTPHVAAAEETTSLHLSVMVRPRRWSDLLQRLVEQTVAEDSEFWGFPYLNGSNLAELERELKVNLARLYEKLADHDPAETMTSLVRWGQRSEGSATGTPFADLARADALTVEDRVSRHPANTVTVDLPPEWDAAKAVQMVDGNWYEMPRPVGERLQRVLAGEVLATGAFLPAAAEVNLKAVKMLARIGAVRILAPS